MHPFQPRLPATLKACAGALFALLGALCLPACDYSPPGVAPNYIANDWRIGSTVRLAMGTEVREGPGIGYCWHTRAPLDQWTVEVIGGPRNANGHSWYNTSRRRAGDPNGGTGWVDATQADYSPAVQYGGTQCPDSIAQLQPGPNGDWLTQLLMTIQGWWRGISLAVRAAVVVVSGVILLALLLAFPRTSSIRISFIQASMVSILVWCVAEQTRALWEGLWIALTGLPAPGLPVFLATLVMAWWIFREWGYRMSGVPRVLSLLLLLVAAAFLLAPQPVDEWVTYGYNLITGRKG